MEKELFALIYRLMWLYEESICDTIYWIDETQGQYDDFCDFIHTEYPKLVDDIPTDNDVDVVEFMEQLGENADVYFLDAYLVASYLAKRKPEIIEAYSNKWQESINEEVKERQEEWDVENPDEEDYGLKSDLEVENAYNELEAKSKGRTK